MKYLQKILGTKVVLWVTTFVIFTAASSALSADIPTSPHIFVDDSGNQVAIWELDAPTSASLSAAIYTASTTSWSTPITISGSQNIAYAQMVGNRSSGNAIVAWFSLEDDSGIYILNTVNYTASTQSWSSPTAVYSSTTESINQFELKMNDDDVGSLIWIAYDTATDNYYTYTSQAPTFGGGWDTQTLQYQSS